MITPCCGNLRELKGVHHHKILEITENAGHCLLSEYMVRELRQQFLCFVVIYSDGHELNHICDIQVDEPSCSTPRKRPFYLPSISSIEELRTPPFEELLRSFWDAKSPKLANGDAKHIGSYEAAMSVRDSRLPLTALN